MKILVIDDQAVFRTMVASFLKNRHHLIFATNGKDGIRNAINNQPDLILLDVAMPGASGFTTCQAIRKIEKIKGIPVIMLTALNKIDDIEKAFESGADEYIPKPIEARTFPALLEEKYQRALIKR